MRPAVHVTLGDGRYRLEKRLGAGGMATVWLAEDERLRRPVAVKIVADTLADDEQWIRRFKREAQAAARLSHPGVVSVFDYGVEDGRPYLVMEYVAGGTLADRIRPVSREDAAPHSQATLPDPERPARLPDPERPARELLHALGAVHAAGILHRDIKPSNLLLDDAGRVRLTDFGIAQPQDGTQLTRTGMVIGTLRYIAPEVGAGEPASIQSDLYSAGVVIREIAGPDPSPPVARLIAALTTAHPEDRPASAPAAVELLGGPTAAVTRVLRSPTPEPATRPLGHPRPPLATPRRPYVATPRRPYAPRVAALLGAAVAIVVVIVLASGGGGGSTGRQVPSPAPAGAPVARQVQALRRIVDSATHR